MSHLKWHSSLNLTPVFLGHSCQKKEQQKNTLSSFHLELQSFMCRWTLNGHPTKNKTLNEPDKGINRQVHWNKDTSG